MGTGADIIAAKLAAAGCRRAFGIPGGEVLALMEALRAAGLTFHLAKNENAGGFMAEGAWHADSAGGKAAAPGVLIATIGPGLSNAVNAVANAYQERVPLIILTGCLDEAEAATYTHQIFDHGAVLREVVKDTFRAAPGALNAVMDKALALAMSGQPGPVHIDVPIPVAEGETEEAAGPPHPAPAPAAPASGDVLEAARDLLARARAPLAIAGVDAVNAGSGEAIANFCRTRGVPLITTYKAKGLLPEDDPLAMGGHGLSPKSDAALKPLIDEADLILLIGYDPIEMRIGWRRPWNDAVPMIEIAPVARLHGMHAPARATFEADIDATLEALGAAPASLVWASGAPAKTRAALAQAFPPEPDWGPGRVFHTLREVMPPETVATADAGAHRILVSQIWRCEAPRSMLQSSALCTMGCALPLGIGHAIAAPDTPVLVFVGDGGMEMGLGELATLRDLKRPVIVAVMVDESLGLIEMKQRAMQSPNVGVDFSGSDFPAVAEAMGGVGRWIDDDAALREEAHAALTRETFTLLACRIGKRAYDGKF